MFVVTVTDVPKAATDFAFDYLESDIDNSSVLEIDYDTQEVYVDTGNMKLPYEVRITLIERLQEGLQSLLQKHRNGEPVTETAYTIDSARTDIHKTVSVSVSTSSRIGCRKLL